MESAATTSSPEFESSSNNNMGLSESSREILAWATLGTVALCYAFIVACLYRKIRKKGKKKNNIDNNNDNKKHKNKNETNPKDGEDDHDVAIEIENKTQGIGGVSGSQGSQGSQKSQQHSPRARAQSGSGMSFHVDGDIYSMNMNMNQMAILQQQQQQLGSGTETTQNSMTLSEGEREITLSSQRSNDSNSSNNGNLHVMNNIILSSPRNITMNLEHRNNIVSDSGEASPMLASAPWSIGMKMIMNDCNNSVNVCGESGDSGNDISMMLNQSKISKV